MPLIYAYAIILFWTITTNAQNLVLDSLQKSQRHGYGLLNIKSNPQQARIFLNGKETGYRTPSILRRVKAGLNTIEIMLPNYMFAKRQILVIADSTIPLSFKLLSLTDPVHVIGDLKLGVLSLPQQPVNTPYLVDKKQMYTPEVVLNTGKHQVVWEGGNRYTSLDTIIEIYPGKLTTFNFIPERLYGNLFISPFPKEADVFLNNRLYAKGDLDIRLATGIFKLKVERNGYIPQEKIINISPDIDISLSIDLEEIPDRDSDGFLDSIDRCPDEYGLYSGCPKQNRRDAFRRYRDILGTNLKAQTLIVSVNTVGFINRVPKNSDFRQFISYFNDGKMFLNNKSGFTFFNACMISLNGIYAAFELGQWHSGLEYKKQNYNPLFISTVKDSYYVVYDTLAGIKPKIAFPSTALSVGVNIFLKRFHIAYSIGYQWEDIVINDLVKVKNYNKYKNGELSDESDRYIGPRTLIRFNNNWWLNKLRIEFDFLTGVSSTPALYASMTLSSGKKKKTGWNTFKAGIIYKFYPWIKYTPYSGSNAYGEPLNGKKSK